MSTAMSRLNAFLDSEMEQVLCFDTAIDAEKFCNEKSSVFIVMPEENPNSFFMVSLLIQQLYREILAVADENGGKLPNRTMFYCDEFGTLPTIQSAEEVILEEERAELLQKIISNLPEMQRRRFLLHYEYEMTYKEIGKIEHCSQQSVGRAVTAAREKIKAEMKKYLNP